MAEYILSSESPVLQSDISFKKTVQPEETIVNYSCEGLDMAPPRTAHTSAFPPFFHITFLLSRGDL